MNGGAKETQRKEEVIDGSTREVVEKDDEDKGLSTGAAEVVVEGSEEEVAAKLGAVKIPVEDGGAQESQKIPGGEDSVVPNVVESEVKVLSPSDEPSTGVAEAETEVFMEEKAVETAPLPVVIKEGEMSSGDASGTAYLASMESEHASLSKPAEDAPAAIVQEEILESTENPVSGQPFLQYIIQGFKCFSVFDRDIMPM